MAGGGGAAGVELGEALVARGPTGKVGGADELLVDDAARSCLDDRRSQSLASAETDMTEKSGNLSSWTELLVWRRRRRWEGSSEEEEEVVVEVERPT